MKGSKPAGIIIMHKMKSKFRLSAVLSFIVVLLISYNTQGQLWKPISGEENLKAIFTNTIMTWGNHERGEYCADGTGTIYAHSSTFPRTWSVQGVDKVCIISEKDKVCYTVEQNEYDPSQYRSTNLNTGKREIVEILPGGCGSSSGSSKLSSIWVAITGEKELRQYFENTVLEWETGRSEFCADGTGTTFAYNNEFARTWTVVGNQICINSTRESECYTIEKHSDNPGKIRVRDVNTGNLTVMEISKSNASSCKK